MRKIAIYGKGGKGGIGKSTTTHNTVAGLAERGNRVMVVGCDQKADSTRLQLDGLQQKTVLDTLREEGEDVDLDDILKVGYKDNRLGTQMIHFMPRDNQVQRAEIYRKTVIDYSPEHQQADEYRALAKKIHNNEMFVVPTPLSINDLEKLLIDFGIAN